MKLLLSPRRATRKISKTPFKVLDAPDLQDDFYLNLLDWSSQNMLSVGLGPAVYLWSACTSQVSANHFLSCIFFLKIFNIYDSSLFSILLLLFFFLASFFSFVFCFVPPPPSFPPLSPLLPPSFPPLFLFIYPSDSFSPSSEQ